MKTEQRIEVAITENPIGLDDLHGTAGSSDGALVTFFGLVREETDGRPVEALHYEAYESMGEAELRRIAEEACSQWSVDRVTIIHRVGRLGVGEISVLVAVGGPHRGAAFDACEYCIDTLKAVVPIWKKEIFADGSETWVNHP